MKLKRKNDGSHRYFTSMDSPLGLIVMISDEEALKEIRFEDQKHFQGIESSMQKKDDLPILIQTREWLESYFKGDCPDPSVLKTAPEGSAFQMEVWEELKKIPYGQLTTYGTIAKTIAARRGIKAMSAQAVGGAVGRNPLGILVPCHRVIGTGGNLTGYAGGMDKKVYLLKLEGFDLSQFHYQNLNFSK